MANARRAAATNMAIISGEHATAAVSTRIRQYAASSTSNEKIRGKRRVGNCVPSSVGGGLVNHVRSLSKPMATCQSSCTYSSFSIRLKGGSMRGFWVKFTEFLWERSSEKGRCHRLPKSSSVCGMMRLDARESPSAEDRSRRAASSPRAWIFSEMVVRRGQ